MSLNIPAAKNYTNPIVALPSAWNTSPVEGSRVVPMEIDWGSSNMGGPNNCVNINLFALASQTISQICAISVDNSQNGADVEFIFPDTSQTYSVPAYTPQAVFPVFTNQTQFYVSSPQAESVDITRFAILNFLPPPIALPLSQEQDAAVFNAIAADVVATTQLIPSTVYGTLEAMNIALQSTSGSSGSVLFTVQDGTGNVVAGGTGFSQSGGNINATLFSLSDLRVRFQQGLKLIISSSNIASGSKLMLNAYYRTP